MSVFVYVTASADDKIIIFKQDQDSGALEKLDEIDAPGRPAPMATDPERRFLYLARRDANELSTYLIDCESGGLSLLGDAPLESDPCFIATDRTGRWLLSAYYLAGRCAVHPIGEDGIVRAPPVEWRATGGGAHAMLTDRSNRFAFVPHIGEGKGPNTIFQFLFDADTGTLTPNDPPTVPQDGELGPRHYCFHPSLDILYFSNEHGCSVTAYHFDPDAGTLSAFQRISTLPSILARAEHVRPDTDQSGRNDAVCSEQGPRQHRLLLDRPRVGPPLPNCHCAGRAGAASSKPRSGWTVHVLRRNGLRETGGLSRQRVVGRTGPDRHVRGR